MQQPPFLRCLIHADNVAARPHHLVRFSVMEKADVAIRKRRVAADAAGDLHKSAFRKDAVFGAKDGDIDVRYRHSPFKDRRRHKQRNAPVAKRLHMIGAIRGFGVDADDAGIDPLQEAGDRFKLIDMRNEQKRLLSLFQTMANPRKDVFGQAAALELLAPIAAPFKHGDGERMAVIAGGDDDGVPFATRNVTLPSAGGSGGEIDEA